MFDSGILASDLIDEIKEEADIAISIPDATYVSWLNALEQLLYTEVIREQGKIELEGTDRSVINIDTMVVPANENSVRFEDIHAVYADSAQLIESTAASSIIFPNTYYKLGENIGLNLQQAPEKMRIIYFVKPALKTEANMDQTNVMLPVEFIDLARAKLRGEAYKLANEDNIASKWLADYNVLLETFKAWLTSKQPSFGL